MKLLRIVFSLILVSLLFSQCKKDEVFEDFELKHGKLPDVVPGKMFTVTVENVSTPYKFFDSGVAAVPSGESEAGPALPGHSFTFSFHAGPGQKLSFATMYGWSNDGFYAPSGEGIDLYSGEIPVTGEITSQVMLWDAGTEANQMPGSGNMHNGTNTHQNVQLMSDADNMYYYGMVSTNLSVNLEYNGGHMFTVTVDNLAGSTTPISPVVWVVHTTSNPLFKAGMKDYGKGLENVAESGDAGPLSKYLAWNSGYVSPVAPVLWVIHDKDEMPIFTENTPDRGLGLELLAETGDPSLLFGALMNDYNSGVSAVPDGAGSAGPLFPGDKYTFSFDAEPGQYLSIASMLGNSNDEFFAFGDSGIKLAFGEATKNITSKVILWDAGTEPNEYPGTKTSNEDVEGGDVRILNDGFPWPDASKVIKVTIRKNDVKNWKDDDGHGKNKGKNSKDDRNRGRNKFR